MKKYLSILLASFAIFSCAPHTNWCTITGFAQGGTYTVKADLTGTGIDPKELKDSIDAILTRIDKSVSGYNKGSLLCRLNNGERIRPDSILIDLYQKSYVIYCKTDGYVDVASAPLYDIWGFGFKSGEFPSDETVSRTLACSGMGRLVPDMKAVLAPDGTLEASDLLLPDKGTTMPKLNFNAVAQGYSSDMVANYLKTLGIRDMMVDIGEIFCQGHNPSGNNWTLGIDRPTDGNNTPGADLQGIFHAPSTPCGIVTSGNYRKFYIRDGKKYAHTVDPKTGYPVSHQLLSATIVASDSFTADALATYCMVIGPEASRDFVLSGTGIEACLISAEGDSTLSWCSPAFQLENPSE